jgi:hypothetical protein
LRTPAFREVTTVDREQIAPSRPRDQGAT